ncbi:unnamed protein product [Acanthoscelides obtectus]|uniref:Peptidase S1 domain-containing protein n=1 Tax=Acanthoscelides obtectus TaxID=200917 RepID=A0A9P0LJ07_ACAOB|nr:unnamed protein product [Acanthoscelides obtectus]CAK1632867.1 Trypsin theta [Acanthoscelides obtectus]
MSLPRSHTVFYHLIIFISSAFIRAKSQNTTECHNTDLGKSLVIITPQFPAVFCTGTLLNGKYVLTAAHCLLRTRLYVYAGLGEDSTNEEQMVKSEVQDYHVHSGYNRITMVNDVAVVHLKTHIDESDSIKYVHFRISTIPAYEWDSCKDGAFVMGLMQANASSTSGAIYCSSATVYPGTECAEVYKKGRFERDMCVLLDFRDLGCVGEPGGPVFCGDAQIGLISWGGCASGMLCKVWGMPTQKSKNVGLGVGKRNSR